MEFAQLSETGARALNEDRLLVLPAQGWFLVADGLGGPGKGDVASALVVEAFQAAAIGAGPVQERAANAFELANRAIVRSMLQDPARKGMGSTATLAVLEDDRLHVWHLGDSRAILVRGGEATVLTEDHTLANQLVKLKQIKPEQVQHHPARNTLLRCLGKESAPKVDSKSIELLPGDRVVLCSDGLHGWVPPAEIAQLATGADLQAVATQLVERAIRQGSGDNVSVVVIACVGVSAGAAAPAPRPSGDLMAFLRGKGARDRAIAELEQAMGSAATAQARLTALLDAIVSVTRAESAVVCDAQAAPLLARAKDRQPTTAEDLDPGLVRRVIDTREGMLDMGGEMSSAATVMGLNLIAHGALPVLSGGDAVGAIYLSFDALRVTPERQHLEDAEMVLGSVTAPVLEAIRGLSTTAAATSQTIPVLIDEARPEEDYPEEARSLVAAMDGVLSVVQLADAVGMPADAVGGIVRKLEERGLIYCRRTE